MLDFSPSLGCRWETLGAVGASSRGTVVTAGTSSAKGTGVSLGTSTFGYQQIVVCAHNTSAAADYCLDIFAGNPASGGYALIPDLRLPSLGGVNAAGLCVPLPIAVASGTTLYARLGSSTSSATVAVCVLGGSNGLQGVPGFSRAVALYTPASSKGVTVTTAATQNTMGSWTQLTAGVTQRLGAILVQVGGAANLNQNFLVRVGAGASGSQWPVADMLFAWAGGSSSNLNPTQHGPDACDVPASTAIWAQAATTLGSALSLDIAAHGLVA